jgi:hypothetical protein
MLVNVEKIRRAVAAAIIAEPKTYLNSGWLSPL